MIASGDGSFRSVPEFPCPECLKLKLEHRFLVCIGRRERPDGCQCVYSSSTPSASSSSAPSASSSPGNPTNSTTNTANNLSDVKKRPAQENGADVPAQKKPNVPATGPFPLCTAGPDSNLWDNTNKIWDCLACGKRNCPFESGTATLMDSTDGQEMEYDECEPANCAQAPCSFWNKGTAYQFNRLSALIIELVSAVFCSKGLWAHYKYLGSKNLDLKIKSWMRWRMGTDAVEKNWEPLRRTVKESLRYRRQLCCEWIHEAWIGQ